jgi:hypothetical protein
VWLPVGLFMLKHQVTMGKHGYGLKKKNEEAN